MSYLVYCVLNGRRGPARPSITGVRGQMVWVLDCGGLCAAVSDTGTAADCADAEIERDISALRLEHLMPYARVVEAFNRTETVVPMRYGCGFDSIAEVRRWIGRRADQLHALLARLDGCVEMGVRALLTEAAARCGRAGPAPAPVEAARPGAVYLAARRAGFAVADHAEHLGRTVCTALSGWFRESISETRWSGTSPMVSLYFLVERRALNDFRAAFGRIGAAGAALMLTGPWPPYSFACDAAAGA